jgi:hypothetical protein
MSATRGPAGPPTVYVKTFTVDEQGYYIPQVLSFYNRPENQDVPQSHITHEDVMKLIANLDPDTMDPITAMLSHPETWGAQLLVKTPINDDDQMSMIALKQFNGVGWYIPVFQGTQDLRTTPNFAKIVLGYTYNSLNSKRIKNTQMVGVDQNAFPPPFPSDYVPNISPALPGILTLDVLKKEWAAYQEQATTCSDKLTVQVKTNNTVQAALTQKSTENNLNAQKIAGLVIVIDNILKHNQAINAKAKSMATKDPHGAVQMLVTANDDQIRTSNEVAAQWSSNVPTSFSSANMATVGVVTGLITAVVTGVIVWQVSKKLKTTNQK